MLLWGDYYVKRWCIMQYKIGIFTFHNVPNFGAALQTYASTYFLKQLGCVDVHVIDYHSKGNSEEFSPIEIKKKNSLTKSSLKRLIKTIIYYYCVKDYKIKYNRFQKFKNMYFSLDSKFDQNAIEYKCLFYGSDQIWNPEITNRDLTYFGSSSPKGTIVASLAASCGDVSTIADDILLLDEIKKFNYISVRENSLKDYLLSKGIPAQNILDPVFLLSKEDYINSLGLEANSNPPYVFVYDLQNNPLLLQLAKRIAKERKLKIHHVCGFMKFGSPFTKGSYTEGPKEFLNELYNADYVITNSFHGLAFSLIFCKDFNVVLPKSRTSRIKDLLDSISLCNRKISGENENVDTSKIDYSKCNNILFNRANETREYVKMVISEVKKRGEI